MAWTPSTTQRRSLALSSVLTSGHRQLSNQLISLGKGDLTRGTCVAFAAFLTFAGVAAPHAGPEALAAFLFLAGASLAVFASMGAATVRHTSIQMDVKGFDEAPARRPQSVPSIAPTQHIAELLMQTSQPAINLAAWSRLTARMSHELRTPLNAVLGFSELMTHEVFGPLGSDRYSAYARDIHLSGQRLLKSTEDALAITALLTGSERKDAVAVASVANAIDEAVTFHFTTLNARAISLTYTINCNLEAVAEPQTLRQIMINLLAEAAAQAAEGASLTISAGDCGGEIEISLDLSHAQTDADSNESFSLLLARTLLELTGSRLVETESKSGGWHAHARLARAAQGDFFAKTKSSRCS